ncbi:cupin domain-containing protein, partial [Thermodesulfobacteriota bacterium]
REPEWSRDRKLWAEDARRRSAGKVVIKGSDCVWEQGEQGMSFRYICRSNWDRAALPFWQNFRLKLNTHTGKHKHQGGLGLYVLEGKGYTIVDGVRYDWEKDDLVILPVKPGGVTHQHFNLNPGKPCEWLAIIFHPAVFDAMGVVFEQLEYDPDYKVKG